MDFSGKIIDWYNQNKRSLPWRETNDPYKIWISEIILQQTRVAQGLEYYLRFISTFPDVQALVAAKPDNVMKLWQGLGYYSRARHLYEAAHQINNQYHGEIPGSYNELIKIKGIGGYSAAAIASMAFHEPVAVVDGNVFRVITRIFMIDQPKGTSVAKKAVLKIAQDVLDPERAGMHNQAIMEFGAIQCIPKNPDCLNCIFNTTCEAFLNNRVEKYPIAGKKGSLRTRYLNYLVIRTGKNILINKRGGDDIWEGLYEFPLIETSKLQSVRTIPGLDSWNSLFNGSGHSITKVTGMYKHLLSHQRINARFFMLELKSLLPPLAELYKSVPIAEIKEYPVPRLIDRFLKDEGWV